MINTDTHCYLRNREATTQLQKQGVCEDLDAKTFALSSFGDQFQFKDTDTCHALVWNYHCLSWVAATFQRVISNTTVSCATVTDVAPLPLPPCRSLCVEVADKCVYSHFYRTYLENVCGNVPCVSEEEEELSAKTNVSKKQAACVKAPWESVANTTFSRCSIREYIQPTASATRLAPQHLWVVLLGIQTALWVYSNVD